MENEKKKTKTKRLVILLAMLALIVFMVALGGTTFAKYITSQSVPTQSATVAKWGYVINVNTSNLFGTQYKADVVNTNATETGLEVKASAPADGNIVAPGTKGYMTISVTGTAEVLSKLTVAKTTGVNVSEVSLKGSGEGNTVNYAPIEWALHKGLASGYNADGTLNGVTDAVATASNSKTLDACITALIKEATDNQAAIAPATALTFNYTLSWEWKFETGADKTEKDQNNIYDTYLGYAADAAAASKTYYDNGDTVAVNNGAITVTTPATTEGGTATTKNYTAALKTEFGIVISVEQLDKAA